MSLRWKVHTSAGRLMAACRFPEDAAVLVAVLGDGATIRDGDWCVREQDDSRPLVVWTEGREDLPAGESYDHVAEVVRQRVHVDEILRQRVEHVDRDDDINREAAVASSPPRFVESLRAAVKEEDGRCHDASE